MREQLYDLTNLSRLIEEANVTHRILAKSMGISISSLTNYLSGVTTLPLPAAINLADYFAVPLDVVIGRCSPEQAEAILSDYSHHFMELRRADYEMYRFDNTRPINVDEGYEAPYPYNLILAVTEECETTDLISEDQEDGIEYALSTLTPREESMIRKRFKDGWTLDKIAENYGLSKERTRQIIAKAVWRLRSAPRRAYILDGYKVVSERVKQRKEAAERLEQDLLEKEKKLEEFSQRLDNLEERLNGRARGLNIVSDDVRSNSSIGKHDGAINPHTVIEELDLSVRPYNCLKKAGIHTVGGILSLAEDYRYMRIRNLGRKSWEEIVFRMALRGYELPGWNDTIS